MKHTLCKRFGDKGRHSKFNTDISICMESTREASQTLLGSLTRQICRDRNTIGGFRGQSNSHIHYRVSLSDSTTLRDYVVNDAPYGKRTYRFSSSWDRLSHDTVSCIPMVQNQSIQQLLHRPRPSDPHAKLLHVKKIRSTYVNFNVLKSLRVHLFAKSETIIVVFVRRVLITGNHTC